LRGLLLKGGREWEGLTVEERREYGWEGERGEGGKGEEKGWKEDRKGQGRTPWYLLTPPDIMI